MDSDTLIGTSPLLQKPQVKVTFQLKTSEDYHRPRLTEAQLFKCDVRNKLNPNLRQAHGILLAIPLNWFDIISLLSESNESHLKTHATTLIEQALDTLFPPISPNHFIFNIQTIVSTDPLTDFLLWFNLFQLPIWVPSQANQIASIKTCIYDYLTKQNVTSIPFMLVSCKKTFTLSRIRKVHSKIRSRVKSRNESSSPLFTLHIQDEQSPYILLWLDTENLCSFNLAHFNTISSRINFANTLVQFINYANC